jgi:hypothetical protein
MSNSSTPPALSSVATVEDDVTAASVTSHRAGAAGFDGGYSSVNWPALGFGLALAVAGITGPSGLFFFRAERVINYSIEANI